MHAGESIYDFFANFGKMAEEILGTAKELITVFSKANKNFAENVGKFETKSKA